jgi:DNA-binding MurR/RpiR family transcriptional regulator
VEASAVLSQDIDEHVSAPANPMVTIRSVLPSLPPAERRVAEGVLAQPDHIPPLSIRELARRASTSEATVVRFCKRAGFAGYPELRSAIAIEVGRATAQRRRSWMELTDVGPDDALAEIVAKVGGRDAQAITDTVEQLDIDILGRVIEAMIVARRIDIYGIGASGLVALDLEHKLRRIGLPATAAVDGHTAMTSAVLLSDEAIAIGISHSGETLDILDPIRLAKVRGCLTLAITNYARSTLARTADLVLTTATRETVFQAGSMASRSAQLTVIDCVYLAVAQRTYERSVQALEVTSAALRSRRMQG